MVAAATKGLMVELIHDAGSTGSGSKISTIKAKHPPRTANHKIAKKATTHGYKIRTARVRKKKRREVNTTVEQKKTTANLLSTIHIELESIAEEKSEASRNITADIVSPKQHNL